MLWYCLAIDFKLKKNHFFQPKTFDATGFELRGLLRFRVLRYRSIFPCGICENPDQSGFLFRRHCDVKKKIQ